MMQAVAVRKIALAGNPNVGKTVLFNALTGANQKVANYPGVTVERKSGRLKDSGQGGQPVEIIDLPGCYSLNPRSIDERIAHDVLVGAMPGEAPPDAVVCVVDATNLERNLYLVTQVLDLGLPCVLALNMTDAAEAAGIEIDIAALSEALGIPVIPLAARLGRGIADVREAALERAVVAPPIDWPVREDVEEEVAKLSAVLSAERPELSDRRRRFEVFAALVSDVLLETWQERAPEFHAAVQDARHRMNAYSVPYQMAETMGRYGWVSPLAHRVITTRKKVGERSLSDKLDAVLIHRIWGPVLFAALLVVIFQAVFTWAVPAMDFIEWAVNETGAGIRAVMPDGILEDVMVEGALTGVGNVIIFLPQILILFFFLGLMEDTGYMARSAFIMDRAMRRFGLSGASVVPMLSAYACAVPGIMAARTLPEERDRIITIMVVPLQGCSARLPVYVLFIGAFIPAGTYFGVIGYQSLAMTSLYFLGTGMAFVAAWVLSRFVFKGEGSSFVMELPPYRLPQIKMVLRRMVDRSKVFVVRAGRIIFGLSILLWILAAYPKSDLPADLEARMAAATTAEQVETLQNEASAWRTSQSYIGRFGRALEPVMAPLGFDWKISAGIVASFAAREVIVSALATIYSAGADADEESLALRDAIKADTYPDGTPVFTPLVAVSLMVFFVFALQCMSTLAIARRELNSWFWPVVMWVYMFGLAYLFSLAIYQGGLALGLG
ncbi:MAG: ferrous iron transport protein B [Rhodothermales bacterium]|nr:ferrous iron transport protein B [Rhodothermales bacterium]MBO6778164.1 ferrous iron transport protein B [Rhodothermales bacterium]